MLTCRSQLRWSSLARQWRPAGGSRAADAAPDPTDGRTRASWTAVSNTSVAVSLPSTRQHFCTQETIGALSAEHLRTILSWFFKAVKLQCQFRPRIRPKFACSKNPRQKQTVEGPLHRSLLFTLVSPPAEHGPRYALGTGHCLLVVTWQAGACDFIADGNPEVAQVIFAPKYLQVLACSMRKRQSMQEGS